ncbi:hypothetical protein A0H81_04517 [Grifola frondosa]|uniref:Uncharacterized protein n=1 Tax=Grifola frondosa TaxID=5627 RepID=A0A1C7ML29_GRIFR|nr:hypothetical protein A0H81_04517 [Grifola frondosa]
MGMEARASDAWERRACESAMSRKGKDRVRRRSSAGAADDGEPKKDAVASRIWGEARPMGMEDLKRGSDGSWMKGWKGFHHTLIVLILFPKRPRATRDVRELVNYHRHPPWPTTNPSLPLLSSILPLLSPPRPMVQLHVSTTKGNSGSRFFPYQGYLGLTPVKVEGLVRTKLDEDGKPILAKSLSVSVRCYESRSTLNRSSRSIILVDQSQQLWSKPDGVDYAPVAELDCPFKITLPTRTPGYSTANYQEYRTFWRLEAVLEHAYIPGVGSRLIRYFDLPLVRYDVPSTLLTHTPSTPTHHSLYLRTSKPRAPAIRYNISTPTIPVGPTDIVFASLFLQPSSPRRIDLRTSTVPPVSTAVPHARSSSSPQRRDPFPNHCPTVTKLPCRSALQFPLTIRVYSLPQHEHIRFRLQHPVLFHHATTPPLIPSSPTYPSPPSSSSDAPVKTLVSTIATSECSDFACDGTGTWTKTLTLRWPSARSHSRWALGETLHSELASVRYFVKTRLVVASAGGATDALELEPRELAVVATGEAERRLALEKYTEQRQSALRSKSRSPWRRPGEAETEPAQLPSPPQSPPQRTERGHIPAASVSAAGTKGKERRKTPRRPHTSAGPRDKSNFPYAAQAQVGMRSDPDHNAEGQGASSSGSGSSAHGRGHARKESGLGESMVYASRGESVSADKGKGRASVDERERERRKNSGLGLQLGLEVEQVRAWEEELARIELQSRRSSADMLGSWGVGKRKRVAGGGG